MSYEESTSTLVIGGSSDRTVRLYDMTKPYGYQQIALLNSNINYYFKLIIINLRV